MPKQRNPHHARYRILNEAAQLYPSLMPGKTEVWYFRPGVARDIMMGLSWLQEQVPEAYPEPYNLAKTHIMLGRVSGEDPEKLFHDLQGDFWSPDGEARGLIESVGLNHTSISVGDILVVKGAALFCDTAGWVNIGRVDKAE
jgi:hypothetical protein